MIEDLRTLIPFQQDTNLRLAPQKQEFSSAVEQRQFIVSKLKRQAESSPKDGSTSDLYLSS